MGGFQFLKFQLRLQKALSIVFFVRNIWPQNAEWSLVRIIWVYENQVFRGARSIYIVN